jgi:transposase
VDLLVYLPYMTQSPTKLSCHSDMEREHYRRMAGGLTFGKTLPPRAPQEHWARYWPSKDDVFAVRAAELTEDRPELAASVVPLLGARAAIEQQIADLERKVMRLARNNAHARRFMTAPGVGPITALCFLATIDDPTRFKRSRSVGAYAGLTTRRYASGEIDWTGRISKCGDAMLRTYLYEAANVLLTPGRAASHAIGPIAGAEGEAAVEAEMVRVARVDKSRLQVAALRSRAVLAEILLS